MTRESLLGGFVGQASRQPQAPALLWKGEVLSYGRLYEMAAASRRLVTEADPDTDAPVGLCIDKSPEAIALILGCLMAGRRFLLPSSQLPTATLEHLYASAGCRRVLFLSASADSGGPSLSVKPVPLDADAAAARQQGISPAVSFMLTTSGSTGVPKIVPLPMAGVERFIEWAGAHFGIAPGKRVLSYAPLNFDICFLDIWATLAHGGCVVPVDPDHATNAAYLTDLLVQTAINVVQGVPMLFRLLGERAQAEACRFESVEHVVFTGDAMPAATLQALPVLFPNARLANIYGCTETNDSFIHELGPADANPPSPVPMGRPLPGVHALLVDEEDNAVTGPGAGELIVATPFQAEGYLAEGAGDGRSKFITRYRDGEYRRFFRTGDIVRRGRDGVLTLQGRKDFQVKVRGVRVNTQEVEQAIASHDDVVEVAVVAVPDATAGHLLHAHVRRRPNSRLNSLRLRTHCAGKLARGAIPSSIEIVDDGLPKTATGKVDRRRLLHLHCMGGENATG